MKGSLMDCLSFGLAGYPIVIIIGIETVEKYDLGNRDT